MSTTLDGGQHGGTSDPGGETAGGSVKLTVVGLGPGDPVHRTPAASDAVRDATVVLGYQPYLDQCADLLRVAGAAGSSAGPTSTSAAVLIPAARNASANPSTVVRITRSSRQLTRATTAAGVSGGYPVNNSARRSSGRAAERYTAIVVPCAANAATDSPAGIEHAVRPPPNRVWTTVCATPGTVNSWPSTAAAAATEPTPGTISKSRPLARHQLICSPIAPYTVGSPECNRTIAAPGCAEYTVSTSSKVIPAESKRVAVGVAWINNSVGINDDAQMMTSAAASLFAPRRVSRSAAPGPAPTKEITPKTLTRLPGRTTPATG
jgi:hypothetical protein